MAKSTQTESGMNRGPNTKAPSTVEGCNGNGIPHNTNVAGAGYGHSNVGRHNIMTKFHI